ncbi:hypothetical protein COCON_G00162530 [Conger conger]|uniref:Prostaglandin G/H synthase 1 n=1 Tax=Conger conger TaxID=82655 RepID=A0A9Q1D6C9_CONCO|nr:hypothetical protein COCON_G00162530 [Conger conger]
MLSRKRGVRLQDDFARLSFQRWFTTKMSSPAWFFALFLLLRGQFCCGNDKSSPITINPCCHYPCENWGVCLRIGLDRYECDCTGTGYYGENCTTPEFWSRIQDTLRPDPDVMNYILTHFQWLWNIINATRLRDWLMGVVLTARSDLIPNPPTYNSKTESLSFQMQTSW